MGWFQFSSEKSQASTYVYLARLNYISIIAAIPLIVTIIALSCNWSNISGQSTEYTDPTTQWQACLTQAQFVTIPLNATLAPVFSQIVNTKAAFSTCIFGLVTNTSSGGSCTTADGFGCVLDIVSDCAGSNPVFPVVNNVQLPIGYILNSLSYLGVQTVIFGFAGLTFIRRAFSHPTWLPATIALITWNLFAIFTYYTVNPIFPVPNQTNATLLITLIYAGSYQKYEDYNNGDNQCRTAYAYLWGYLSLLLLLTFIVFLNLIFAIIGEAIKLQDKNGPKHIALEKTIYPSLLLLPAAVFYILIAVSKAYGSSNCLECISNFNYSIKEAVSAGYRLWFPSIWYPFVQPTLDINTVLFIATFMSVLRGYTIQSVSAFRLAFGTAMIYSLASYSPVVGAIQFFITNNFNNYEQCYGYFLNGENKAFFGYPNEDEAKAYCTSFRIAMAGNLGLFVTVHLIVLASYFTFQKNENRSSLVIEAFDPSLYDIPADVGLSAGFKANGSFSSKSGRSSLVQSPLTKPLVINES